MEAGIGDAIAVEIIDIAECPAGLVAVLDLRHFVGCRMPGRQPRADALIYRHHLEHLDQLGHAEPGDDRAAMRADADEAFRRELAQRFAHRRARGPVAFGQPGFVEPLARLEVEHQDFIFDLELETFGDGQGHEEPIWLRLD